MEMRATRFREPPVREPKQAKKPRMERVSLSKEATLRRVYKEQLPAWRKPSVGYVLSIPLVGLTFLCSASIEKFLHPTYLPGSILTLAVLFSALAWGVGPALFSLLLCIGALDYFIVPPTGHLDFYALQGLGDLIPFTISGLVIALITAQRERARIRALVAEYDATAAAEDLEATNRKLEEANELKDRFFSVASHELKTPITTIRGQAQLVLRRISKQHELSPEMESIKKTLEKINEQTGRLTALIDELMDVSSSRAGKMELHLRPCDLLTLCRETIEDQHMLTGRTITLTTTCDSLGITADADRLTQVLVNLISNALKYSPEDTPVEVHVCEEPAEEGATNKKVRIAVTDHGKGIPKDQQPRIFEAFYRTPDAQSSAKGLGLGLAICKDIVERHHGSICCMSEPGKGSTFVVELPEE
jgi:signal transduction histidine kinase